jgi:uncharacterized protein involved in type VI secretion and phage assembly
MTVIPYPIRTQYEIAYRTLRMRSTHQICDHTFQVLKTTVSDETFQLAKNSYDVRYIPVKCWNSNYRMFRRDTSRKYAFVYDYDYNKKTRYVVRVIKCEKLPDFPF